jgi:hypothetical protein
MGAMAYFAVAVGFSVVVMSDLINYITRVEGSELLGVGIKSLANMEKKGLIPTPAVRIQNDKTGRPNIGYDRAIFVAWVKTNPVKHPGYKDAEKRLQHYAAKEIATANEFVKGDLWNIRKNRKNFEYNGMAADIIIFCQPELLNRGLKFSNQD